MILPDVNLLLYAYDTAAPHHLAARDWWEGALSGDEPVGLAWVTLLAFVRITTRRAIFEEPFSVDEAVGHVDSWLAQPQVMVVHPGHRHAEHLFRFLRRLGTAGNLTTDAHLAALAIEHGCTLHSTDADFARFPGLRWRNPLTR